LGNSRDVGHLQVSHFFHAILILIDYFINKFENKMKKIISKVKVNFIKMFELIVLDE
jgi:hypothetical protein